jgi:hypothetical protein
MAGLTPRVAAIPAALQPKTPKPPQTAHPAPPQNSDLPVLHIAIVVPDIRLQKLLKDHVYVIGPTTTPSRVTAHVVLDDKQHGGTRLHPFWRWALVETGLLPPEDVGLVTSAQVELGWSEHEAREGAPTP